MQEEFLTSVAHIKKNLFLDIDSAFVRLSPRISCPAALLAPKALRDQRFPDFAARWRRREGPGQLHAVVGRPGHPYKPKMRRRLFNVALGFSIIGKWQASGITLTSTQADKLSDHRNSFTTFSGTPLPRSP